MAYECVIPDMNTMVDFKDPKSGETFAQVDLAELETIIIQCRVEDPHFKPDDALSINAWTNRCAKALSQRLGRPIGIGATSLILRRVFSEMAELKKNLRFETRWTSQDSTDSTPSPTSPDSPPSLESDSCITTSGDSRPIENLEPAELTPG